MAEPELPYILGNESYQIIREMREIVNGSHPLDSCIIERTRLLSRYSSGRLFDVALWSKPMLRVVVAFLIKRTAFSYTPLPEAALESDRVVDEQSAEAPGADLHSVPVDVHSYMVSFWDLPSVRSVAGTSRFYHRFVADAFQDHITALVAFFGLQWSAFRLMLDSTDSQVSGDVALLALFLTMHRHFLFTPTTMEINTTMHRAPLVIRFLYLHANYLVFRRNAITADTEWSCNPMILEVIELRQPNATRSLYIIVSTTNIATMPILCGRFSHMYNWFDAKAVFCSNRDATFRLFRVVNSAAVRLKDVADMLSFYESSQSVEAQGVAYTSDMAMTPHRCTVHPLCPLTIRTTINAHTFYMRFEAPTPSSEARNAVRDDAAVLAWGVGGLPCHDNGLGCVAGFVRKVFTRSPRPAEGQLPVADMHEIWREHIRMVQQAADEAELYEAAHAHIVDTDARRVRVRQNRRDHRARIRSDLLHHLINEPPSNEASSEDEED
ncbi:hypothetical protein C8J57DRAFT_1540822 [Mycena rebaudengoi]|nr:hypothetical protein C8J57DRAFT_1540822 [Mycena rebaudengoi]